MAYNLLFEGEKAWNEFLDKGDMDGSAVWRRVLKAINEIRREEPHEGEAVN